MFCMWSFMIITRWYHRIHGQAAETSTSKPYVFVLQPDSCWQNSGKSPFHVDKQYQEVWEVEVTEKYKHSVHIQNITETNKRSATVLGM